MIINRLTLYNFGVYAGTNTFEFANKKPVVLIGGMNGRGKTTFLEAILLALYGVNSFAYKEGKFHSYGQYLRSYVNTNHWSRKSYIELEFLMNEGTNDTYLIRREWDALTRITKENICVCQNGEESEFLTKNWAIFVENMLPSALSSFYFFDGEKIAELAVDKTSEQIRESIRSMLGISILDVLKNDLGRSIRRIRRKNIDNQNGDQLEKLRQEKENAIAALQEMDLRIDEVVSKISGLENKIEQLHQQYEAKGGGVLEQQKDLINKRAETQSEITQNSEALIGIAGSELPLYLVKSFLNQIKLQAEDEHNDFIMKQALEKLNSYLNAYADLNRGGVEENRHFIEFVEEQTRLSETEPVYQLSDHALFQLNGLIESTLDLSVEDTKKLLKRKKKLEKQSVEIESHLSLDINKKEVGSILDAIKAQEEELLPLRIELSKLQQERSGKNADVISKTAEFKHDVELYLEKIETHDDYGRMLKYSNMALEIIDAYTIELQKRKTGNLSKTITDCYKKLANKKHLVEEIVMDPETLNMEYFDGEGRRVPKESLSTGEKQMMVIAILWALALCSQKKLPVIIDTPLSRLDSQHRTAIITTYFPNASDQTIILSTDTEIDRNSYDMMADFVGDEFTLVYSEETKSTSIQKGYF